MDSDPLEASPAKSVIEALDDLRSEFRSALQAYASRIESEIGAIQQAASAVGAKPRIPPAKLRDLRDMLTLLRKFAIKPEKGRRKDLKKIDDLIGDLAMLIEHWK